MSWAIITGASSGIGRELALVCARDGYDVVLVARSEAALTQLAAKIESETRRSALVVALDLAQPEAPQTLFQQLGDRRVEVELLANNAGFGLLGHFAELDIRQIMQMVQLNIAALTELSRLFLPSMISRRCGYILNVASTAAFQPGPLMAVYYASKSYVLSFSVALANEAKDAGVVVSCLCPGPTTSDFAQRAGMTKSKLFQSGSKQMTSAAVAIEGYRALKSGKPIHTTGGMDAAMAFLTRFAPISFTAAMARRMQEI